MSVNQLRNDSLWKWLSIGGPTLVLFALSAAYCVHVLLGIRWQEVTSAAIWFAAIQIVTLGCMYFARRYYRSKKNARPAVLIFGLYCWGIISLGVHYTVEWGLFAPKNLSGVYAYFAVAMLLIIILMMFVPFDRIG